MTGVQTCALPILPWLDGLRVQIVPGNEMSRALYLSGLYEPTVAVVIQRLLPAGGTFFDVGANMGLFSLLAASWVGAGGQVHAFEPSAREHARLVEHVRFNGLEGRVRAERVALAEHDGTVGLHVAEDSHSGHNTLSDGFANAAVAEVGVETVEACTLDSYVRRHDVRRIDVVKIDGVCVRDALKTGKGQSFLKAMTGLCNDLGIATVAEMVESTNALAFLRACGVAYGQGYLFGRPSENIGDFVVPRPQHQPKSLAVPMKKRLIGRSPLSAPGEARPRHSGV